MSSLAHPVSYRRSGGYEPADNEQLEVAADGSFELWRSVSVGRVGAFGGTLGEAEADDLARSAEAAHAAGREAASVGGERVRGRALEELSVGDVGAVLGGAGDPGDGWGDLLRTVRHLVLDLVDRPVAALEARLSGDASVLTLEVIGSEPLGVDIAGAKVTVHALDRGVASASWSTVLSRDEPEGPDTPDAPAASLDDAIAASVPWREPGWSLEVQLPHGLAASGTGQGPAWQADLTGTLTWRDHTAAFAVRTTAPEE